MGLIHLDAWENYVHLTQRLAIEKSSFFYLIPTLEISDDAAKLCD